MIVGHLDWDRIDFVVFDVDGTLYNQRKLRLRMARAMIIDALTTGDTTSFRVLRAFRSLREVAGEAETDNFQASLVAQCAERTRQSPQKVEAIIADWIERRPLAFVKSCLYEGVEELFAALRRRNKAIGIYSDYPADEKLIKMKLSADHVSASTDADVGILKPNPRGLQLLMDRARVTPAQTVLIGDRPERDGAAARRAGVLPLIRSTAKQGEWITFSSYSDPLFSPLLAGEASHGIR